ncbi:UNVERIFIED_CONTAM: hypothetical protein HHA_223485 [Hammondia hammondi]|eukprot:XP_008881732.1 hypothetical protein HHA_223485 [Hammondia hammondi]
MRVPGFPSLTFRADSLLVQCCIAACVWYGPQDAAAVGLMYWLGRQHGRKVTPPHKLASDGQTALQEFLRRKNLTSQQVAVDWKGANGYVNLRS